MDKMQLEYLTTLIQVRNLGQALSELDPSDEDVETGLTDDELWEKNTELERDAREDNFDRLTGH